MLKSNLEWTKQVNESCLRSNQKLSVRFLHRKTLDLLYKVIVRSIIDYGLPVYANSLKVTEIARFERVQYRAAKLVTGALHFTSQEKLNIELGWESIKKRVDFLGLCLFQKMHLHLTRPLVNAYQNLIMIKEQGQEGAICHIKILDIALKIPFFLI